MFITLKRRYSNKTTSITTTGNWVAPEGYYLIKVEAWGGGESGYQGGTGGSYARLNSYSVTPGNSYFISVGRGGISSDLSNQTQPSGSYFVTQSLLYAAKGSETSIGDVTYSGGSKGVDVLYPGGGGSAFENANGGNGSGSIGGIGKGNGGRGGPDFLGGKEGLIPGGGGGAGPQQTGLSYGGSGGDGLVLITKLN